MRTNPTPVDWAAQRAVLSLALAAYPKVRTMPELGREIGSVRTAKRAVKSLIDSGLLEPREVAFLATPAAILCHRLDNW